MRSSPGPISDTEELNQSASGSKLFRKWWIDCFVWIEQFYILILVFFDYVVFETYFMTLLEVSVIQLNHITITIERFMNISNLIYDQKGKTIRSRGCTNKYLGTISVCDSGSYTTFQIECLQNLCNNIIKIKKNHSKVNKYIWDWRCHIKSASKIIEEQVEIYLVDWI
jgi:hypothetical protein